MFNSGLDVVEDIESCRVSKIAEELDTEDLRRVSGGDVLLEKVNLDMSLGEWKSVIKIPGTRQSDDNKFLSERDMTQVLRYTARWLARAMAEFGVCCSRVWSFCTINLPCEKKASLQMVEGLRSVLLTFTVAQTLYTVSIHAGSTLDRLCCQVPQYMPEERSAF